MLDFDEDRYLGDKTDFIDAYFDKWRRDIERAETLLRDDRFVLEGYLVLVCYLGALASQRFPLLKDNEAYCQFTLEYSGKRAFYEQIDLLFLYQWPRSKLRDHGDYTSFNEYSDLVQTIGPKFGTENNLSESNRYVNASMIISEAKSKIPHLDETNLEEKLKLFSLVQLLYRYGRCDAVHNAIYPLLNEGVNIDGDRIIRDNSALTRDIIFSTVKHANDTLWQECKSLKKWPHEI
jgi:hypothetical protein